MENNRILQGVLGLLLGYNVVFFAAHIKARRVPSPRFCRSAVALNIFELIAVMVLFVDLVLRFDHIASSGKCSRGRGGPVPDGHAVQVVHPLPPPELPRGLNSTRRVRSRQSSSKWYSMSSAGMVLGIMRKTGTAASRIG